ncbi:hypothetical protein A2X44_05240 [candidate division CPR3 bacterium GWF2_35_18]|uniref:KOW domain-containing protein n=1 Tax=candidate division CPR3 bacterium GW2011_GWF2_35_18 TaxID=1618350 RepID=A0A0G0C167_UNCC3|nr:MAG: hypothetical protein UR67_C0003G0121 [candidate division CPR3 bacterium GW2011_GWF2_35_18]OGB63728.1 MAG: hypothetical protein A2X44_05240 [candidate division CPR3 bacterium GWF2_35_18]OGB64952.1 MAG: hypothetical protein A2250_00805 [candidate division CPR3 bacterium RIFOXYA2_FULL_35_13]OGB76570.1 MAG: hypothetical protein A2476_00965 [candidate division CPR3 bacterium RIFOXYC2_FULL_35_7]OGB78627.1 MAG: hypothetical protein A2296_00815 [candidate division CPR3 bacterium RIFOXYB2_FULL_3
MFSKNSTQSELLLSKKTLYEENVNREIERNLISEGTIFAKKGESVSPADIIGECYVSRGFRIFNIAETLGIKPNEISNYLKKEPGSKVFKGEVLAEKKRYLGVLTRQFIVPCDGILEGLNQKDGQLTIRFLPEKNKLLSGFYGEVQEVNEGKSVILKTEVHVIRGQIGMGIKREGIFNFISDHGDNITPLDVDAQYARKILLLGSLVSKDIVQKCLALGVKGIIGGGINFKDYQSLIGSLNPREDVGVSILILTGFGRSDIDSKITGILQKYQHRHVILDPQSKELLIPLSPTEWLKKRSKKKSEEIEFLKIGNEVLILSWPYLGKRGIITGLEAEKKNELSSCVSVFAAKVKISDGKEVTLPIRNLQLI